MSEYQYYEFQTVDHRLSDKQMAELRKYSTRAKITPTSFTNEYSYGDFKGNVNLWMENFFDAFLYTASWGTHRFDFALPVDWISQKAAMVYCPTDSASVRQVGKKLIFRFISENEDGRYCDDEEASLSTLMGIREDIANGDLRGLYLAWLSVADAGELNDNDLEPPVPDNLHDLPQHLSALVDFLRIDADLLKVAAQNSAKSRPREFKEDEIAKWIASLPIKSKDEILVRLMKNGNAQIQTGLRNRFSQERTRDKPVEGRARRTVGALLKQVPGRSI